MSLRHHFNVMFMCTLQVKLTIAIEDAREVERRRLLGIDGSDTPSREDLAAALEEVSIITS